MNIFNYWYNLYGFGIFEIILAGRHLCVNSSTLDYAFGSIWACTLYSKWILSLNEKLHSFSNTRPNTSIDDIHTNSCRCDNNIVYRKFHRIFLPHSIWIFWNLAQLFLHYYNFPWMPHVTGLRFLHNTLIHLLPFIQLAHMHCVREIAFVYITGKVHQFHQNQCSRNSTNIPRKLNFFRLIFAIWMKILQI